MGKHQSAASGRSVWEKWKHWMHDDATGGVLLLACTVLALVWANSPWGETYHHFWETKLRLGIPAWHLEKSIHHWINDGLMAIFFFVVGLEIKREILVGELATGKKAVFPMAAALGGMVIPAALYLAFNHGSDAARGWGIPMATDIAFAIGILSLMKKHVAASSVIFLTALAIVDDMGAVLVIAVFYTDHLNLLPLALGAGLMVAGVLINRAGSRSIPVYMLLFALLWLAVLKSGVHATVAGVLAALIIPLRPPVGKKIFANQTRESLDGAQDQDEGDMKGLRYLATSPLQRLESTLHPWVILGIMPLFALSNAGVTIKSDFLQQMMTPVALGIIIGLVVGKQLGIFTFAWMSEKAGLGMKPANSSYLQLYGIGWIGGIGFTMSLFIANLAFEGSHHLENAKAAILMASFLAGLGGLLWLRLTSRKA